MEKASRGPSIPAGGNPGMAAVMGLPADTVAARVEQMAKDGVFLANYNSPAQVVLSGTAAGLAKAEEALKAGRREAVHRVEGLGTRSTPAHGGSARGRSPRRWRGSPSPTRARLSTPT